MPHPLAARWRCCQRRREAYTQTWRKYRALLAHGRRTADARHGCGAQSDIPPRRGAASDAPRYAAMRKEKETKERKLTGGLSHGHLDCDLLPRSARCGVIVHAPAGKERAVNVDSYFPHNTRAQSLVRSDKSQFSEKGNSFPDKSRSP